MSARRAALLVSLGVGPACGTLLGFEDATLDSAPVGGGGALQDAAEAATTSASSASSSSTSSSSSGAGGDGTGGAGGDGGHGGHGAGQGGSGGGDPACAAYCGSVMANCVDAYKVYSSEATCLAVCAELPPGSAGDQSGNTVACRAANAAEAGATGEPEVHCPIAGPGGEGVCGTNCEGYCTLMLAVCAGYFSTEAECQSACAGVPDPAGYGVSSTKGNTLDCRLYHLSAAAIAPQVHCPHAAGQAPCVEMDAGVN